MTRSSRGGTMPRRLLIAVAAALVPLAAGCEAGTNAPTLRWHQPTDGTHKLFGNITISNAFVLGAPIGAVVRRGQNAGLFLGLVNMGSGADRLVSVKAPGEAGSVRLPAGGVPLVSQSRVLLTGPQPMVLLENLIRPLAGGSTLTLYLTFARAGTTRLVVPVMPRSSYYTTLSPAPASPSPGTSGKHHKAKTTASPSPSSSS